MLIVQIAGDRKRHSLNVHNADSGMWHKHVQRQLLLVLFLLYDIEKSYVNAGMPESFGSQLPQSSIGIPPSGFSPVLLVTD